MEALIKQSKLIDDDVGNPFLKIKSMIINEFSKKLLYKID